MVRFCSCLRRSVWEWPRLCWGSAYSGLPPTAANVFSNSKGTGRSLVELWVSYFRDSSENVVNTWTNIHFPVIFLRVPCRQVASLVCIPTNISLFSIPSKKYTLKFIDRWVHGAALEPRFVGVRRLSAWRQHDVGWRKPRPLAVLIAFEFWNKTNLPI
jgi:hypothetical protein